MSENLKLTVDTGSMLIDIENERGEKIGEFEFIPTDSNILKRYESVIDFFNNSSIPEGLSADETTEAMKKLSDDVEKQINYLLGTNSAGKIFGECGALTIIANGDFFFENVLEGIGNLIEKIFEQRTKKKLAKLKKATEKYHGNGKA